MRKNLSAFIGDKAFYAKVLAIAMPIMLQNGVTQFVSMLDNLMVGRVGTVEMTGVAVANQLFFVFMLCLFGAVSGVGIFGAQFYGKGDNQGLQYSVRLKVILCGVIVLVGAGVFWFGGEWLCTQFLKGEGDVADAAASLACAKQYLHIILLGMVPTAIIQIYASTLRETGETLLSMKAGFAAVLVNLILNYVLIFGHFGAPRLGAAGAAIATVISRFVEAAIVAVWTHTHGKRFPFIVGIYRAMYIPLSLAGRMLRKGVPLMVNESLWSVGMTVLNLCYSFRGLDVVAAANISVTFWNVFSVTFMATGTAIGIIVGQMLGAGEFDIVRDTVRKLIAFSLLVSGVMGGLYIVAAQYIPFLYNTTDTVRHLATGMMCISAVAMPLVAFAHASYFTLRSGGKTGITFLFDSVFVWAFPVPLAFVLTRYTAVSFLMIYAMCQAVDILKCLLGYILLKKGIWIQNVVDE